MTIPFGARMRCNLATLALVAVSAAVTACGTAAQDSAEPASVNAQRDGYAGTLVKDPPLRPADIVLRDTQGRPFHLGQFRTDMATALFFGFTNCEDVCPTTMADLAAARRTLPLELRERVEVVFVTVDPRRDTSRVLDRWLGRFDDDLVGLRGPLSLVHQAERSLYATQSSVQPQNSAGGHHLGRDQSSARHEVYEVSHSGSVYVFGPGDTSVLYTGGTTAAEYAKDFTRMLRST